MVSEMASVSLAYWLLFEKKKDKNKLPSYMTIKDEFS